ncbi:armadillo-type protein [Syncephalis pseudoplumigaleata]|uniref:non-specific serine/threonine protein kinase n=1 Tax=Syncephalis pseudoplumigaleata TaxID=1712513 RepID=A0A4P9YWI5_9FUNG|nr:armadillo-type protein [Syncephalis pseudoplumigaleata]|eukprot:RKP23661.1 armadillo-type protein [Syncephalis pseudoplumigaleata]
MALSTLQSQLQDHAVTLLVDPDSTVRRALLGGMTRLCVALGRRRANDLLLSHMLTYLNDNDWLLRCAFFETIVGVATFVGGRSLEEYILPLMVQSLADAEEYVIERVLSAMASLTSLGLFQKSTVRELVSTVAPLMCHPNDWIRWGAISFVLTCGKLFTLPDFWSILYPIIRPMLANDITELDQTHLMAALKPPLSRALFDLALTWAGKSKSFANVIGQSGNVDRVVNSHLTQPTRQLAEDDQYMEKLQHMGMTVDDEKKLHRMRKYITKLVESKQNIADMEAGQPVSVFLRNVGVTARTTFLTSPWEANPSEDKAAKLVCLDESTETLSPKVEAKTSVNNTNAEAKLEMPLQESLADTISVMELTLEEPPSNPVDDPSLLDTTKSLPPGALVAHLTEHTAAVNQVCLAPDHAFFATCSDDGTVKIWDCSRLGRHFDNTSRSTYYELEGPVKCMTFIEGRHCIAAAASNGAIHVFRVDYKGGSSAPQYGRCHSVFEFSLEGEQPADNGVLV